jgi:hypothetical protein
MLILDCFIPWAKSLLSFSDFIIQVSVSLSLILQVNTLQAIQERSFFQSFDPPVNQSILTHLFFMREPYKDMFSLPFGQSLFVEKVLQSVLSEAKQYCWLTALHSDPACDRLIFEDLNLTEVHARCDVLDHFHHILCSLQLIPLLSICGPQV